MKKKEKPKLRKPTPMKPPKIETPKTVYNRRKKHPKKGEDND